MVGVSVVDSFEFCSIYLSYPPFQVIQWKGNYQTEHAGIVSCLFAVCCMH